MRMYIIICIVVTALSFLLPLAPTYGRTWLVFHISIAGLVLAAVSFLVTALSLLKTVFSSSSLGGVIGTALKTIAVGLACIGLVQLQSPLMDILGLWESQWIVYGGYYFPYIVGSLIMLIGLYILSKFYQVSIKIPVIVSLFFICTCIFLAASVIPAPELALKFKTSTFLYLYTLGIETLALSITVIATIMVWKLRSSINKSNLNLFFSPLLTAMIFLSLAYLQLPYFELTGWYNTYIFLGGLSLLFIISSFFFFLFTNRIQLYTKKLTIKK